MVVSHMSSSSIQQQILQTNSGFEIQTSSGAKANYSKKSQTGGECSNDHTYPAFTPQTRQLLDSGFFL